MTVGIAAVTGPGSAGTPFQAVPFSDTLPAPLYFRSAEMPAGARYPRHSHAWGEFVYSYSGVMEISLADGHFLAPPQFGVWLPPTVEHQGLNRHAACHCSLYVSGAFTEGLPQTTCAVEISPLLRAMLEHLKSTDGAIADHAAHMRLLEVTVDLIRAAPRVGSFLPWSTDRDLQPILARLDAEPGDNRSIAEFARQAGLTERTLIRRAIRDLGMPFSEWKQRLRVVKAMGMLEAGETVEAIARRLGYSSASAFIAMFRRVTRKTPDAYRQAAATTDR